MAPLTKALAPTGGFSCRLLYLDGHGIEQVAVLHSTSTPAGLLESGYSTRRALHQAFTALGCTLLSAQMLVEGSHPIDMFEDEPIESVRMKPRLALVPKAVAAMVGAFTVGVALSAWDPGPDPDAAIRDRRGDVQSDRRLPLRAGSGPR
jgi:hypothetical protein